MAPIKHRHGEKVEYSDIEREQSHQVYKRDDPKSGDFTRDLGYFHRPAELLNIPTANEKVPNKRSSTLNNKADLLDRHADRFHRTRLIKHNFLLRNVAGNADT